MQDQPEPNCWICKSSGLLLVRPGALPKDLSSTSFAITDANYGLTADIYKCPSCGFLQCSSLEQTLPFYEDLEDPGYELGRAERKLQSKKLLDRVIPFRKTGRLLDIGAGSGILVEAAIESGYNAVGVEPSRWLQKKAIEHNLPVHLGVFPHSEVTGKFDVITFVDVIEHVPIPVELLTEIASALAPDGYVLIVTPDVSSLAARMLSWKWWHFRIAHIGYFNHATLYAAAEKAGLQRVAVFRPGWYFRGGYLWDRVMQYAPSALRLKCPGFFSRMVIPLNLFDSIGLICTPERNNEK